MTVETEILTVWMSGSVREQWGWKERGQLLYSWQLPHPGTSSEFVYFRSGYPDYCAGTG